MGECVSVDRISFEGDKPKEDQNFLAARLKEVQTRSKARIERVESFLNPKKPAIQEKENRQIPHLEILKDIQDFLDNKPASHELFFLQSSPVVEKYSVYKKQQTDLQKELTKQKRILEQEFRYYGGEFTSDDEEKTLFSTMLSLKDKFQGRIKELKITNQMREIEKQLQLLEEQQRQTDEFFLPVVDKRDEFAAQKVKKETEEMRDDYGAYIKEALGNKQLRGEITESYIRMRIQPKIEKMGDKEEFLQTLRSYFQASERSEREQFQEKLNKLTTNEDGFDTFSNELRHIYNERNDTYVLQSFLSHPAADDFARMQEVIEKSNIFTEKRKDEILTFVQKIINVGMEQKDYQRLNDKNIPFKELNLEDIGLYGFRGLNIVFWKAMGEVPMLHQAFGPIFENLDNSLYSMLLEQSLHDFRGDYIPSLQFYPTPEAIRNLILLAAADQKNYRTNHANVTLYALAQRQDWEQILGDAILQYPLLEKSRELLLTWEFTSPENHPKIQKVTADFTRDIFLNQKDKNIVFLAKEALQTDSLLDMLFEMKILSKEERQTFNAAIEAIRQIEEKKGQYQYPFNSISSYYFLKAMREISLQLDNSPKEKLQRLYSLARKIEEQREDLNAMAYLTNYTVASLVQDASLSGEKINTLLDAYILCPTLITNQKHAEFLAKNHTAFLDKEGLSFIQRISSLYAGQAGGDAKILNLTAEGIFSRERAEALAPKLKQFSNPHDVFFALNHPNIFLQTDQDVQFLSQLLEKYDKHRKLFDGLKDVMTTKLGDGSLRKDIALLFPEKAELLMNDKMKQTLHFIFDNVKELLTDASDIDFLNKFVAIHGRRADSLIREYNECIKANVLTKENRDIVFEFTQHFKVALPSIIREYITAKNIGREKMFLLTLKSIAEKIISSSSLITEEERSKPFFKDLIKHVFPSNSGNWSSYEQNETCSDRTTDIEKFKRKSQYQLDLISGSEIIMKDEEVYDSEGVKNVQKDIMEVNNKAQELGYDKEKIKKYTEDEATALLTRIRDSGGLEHVDMENIHSSEEKLFLILIDSLYGTKTTKREEVKSLLIAYEFATFENVQDYIQGTNDRVSKARNQEYALLNELHMFFGDRLKELSRHIIQKGWENTSAAAVLPEYFQSFRKEELENKKKEEFARLRLDRLGISDSFIQQMIKILKGRSMGTEKIAKLKAEFEKKYKVDLSAEQFAKMLSVRSKEYSPDQAKRLVHLYELRTKGLEGSASTSLWSRTREFYGQLKSQREKTLKEAQGKLKKQFDPKIFHLEDLTFDKAIEFDFSVEEGIYDDEQFAVLTAQNTIDLFGEERIKIESELEKFTSLKGTDREILHAYIIKTKESAHARMTGGVCVSGDNPAKDKTTNMWDMENYFQLVFQDPDTYQCQGLVLLHHFEDQGKRILTASLNPSSTYLYSVDEKAFFEATMQSLEDFAKENRFDIIAFSKNKQIRTNRTGGIFEQAINEQVKKIDKPFSFSENKQFSHNPNYILKDLDIVWENN